ncbi:hypothetical protein [Pseudomonas citronellolis]|uniref:hypothetical protein n=1 Tax=Pseudomonas citronellolis TaxID=53408 RepID=UPI0023E3E646|nr:hypothetical protein [Pseudomonas citronellolis]MDF3933667.1 hypothetical protein [Pseudomonas citronellolis]
MKLIGSATEKEIREALISSASYIFGNLTIIVFLEKMLGALSSVYVLGHTPDQGEDFYVVLVNGSVIARFEVSRVGNAEPKSFTTTSVHEYRKALRGRRSQLKLAIAVALATGK